VVARYLRLSRMLDARMQRHLSGIHNRVREIAEGLENDLEGYGEDLTLPDRPEAEAEGDLDEPLYNSDRDYFEQLQRYRQYQNKE
jgi:hypothetical protein